MLILWTTLIIILTIAIYRESTPDTWVELQNERKDEKKQKFSKYQFIHICKNMPLHMSHFKSDFYGIIGYSYAEKYWGDDYKSYMIYQIENGKVVNGMAWYQESQISLLEKQNKKLAEKMIKEFKERMK